MNLNKTLGRVATTLVAGAMLTALAMPAYALDNASADKGQYTGGTFKIAKHLELADNTFAPAQTFTFKIAKGIANEAEKAKGIEDGVEGAVPSTASATTKANDTADEENAVKALTDDLTVTIGEGGITHAGSYKYTITEADTAEEGATVYDEVAYDSATLTMYVHVKNVEVSEDNPQGLAVDFVELFDPAKAGSEDKGKTDGFNNQYNKDLYTLTLTKIIDGAGANMNATFGFKVKVDSEYSNSKWLVIDMNGDGKYNHDEVIVGDDTVTDTWIELKDNVESAEFKLGHEQSAQIIGLTNGDSYTIVESDAGNGYTTTATKNDGKDNVADNLRQVTGNNLKENETVTYTNLKVAVTPTGIVMNVAPYVLLVVVAAAGCFVFLRKRRED